jgi:1-acyl-sn-glycerol-3-phosphate acyltransferase
VAKGTQPKLRDDQAVICYANHPGWWDPLMAMLMHQLFLNGRSAYAPIDQRALTQYPMFRRLGFYGIDLASLRGAKQFLSVTRALLRSPTTAIWMTPGGKFTDVRTRTAFEPGLAHVAAAVPRVTLLPVAVEYAFWDERTPEALIEFGSPVFSEREQRSKGSWQQELEDRLAASQSSLACKVIDRKADQFEVVLDGSAGIGGWYDLLRRFRARLTGAEFDPRHGGRLGSERRDD